MSISFLCPACNVPMGVQKTAHKIIEAISVPVRTRHCASCGLQITTHEVQVDTNVRKFVNTPMGFGEPELECDEVGNPLPEEVTIE